jgi:hypothetical protein
MVHDMHMFEVKKPSESKEPWDDYKLIATIPAEEAFQPLSHPLVRWCRNSRQKTALIRRAL